ncbi:MAG: 4-hydroxy-3-methylbut-2-enyl diphosphate reductase [Gammaproteobacteria bacterium]|nr:4-hydroxy-3-methylbut-2-enyl diphosphate reductase [Gammaproteobacteria bacterium]
MSQAILANPRGFCAGVDRAIDIVNRALDIYGAPIYVRHEVVHNTNVVNTLKDRGAIFVDEVDEVPDDSVLIFSAHGVSQAVRKKAESRPIKLFDATCPLVTKVHLEVARYSKNSISCILIGHKGHPEVDGTLGQYDCQGKAKIYLVENLFDVERLTIQQTEPLAYVTQTTLSMDDTIEIIAALKNKYPGIQGPKKNDICYATQNRQDAVKRVAKESDVVFIVGSQNSSNSNRLKEVADKLANQQAYLIDSADEITKEMISHANVIGISAGASAPEHLVVAVRNKLTDYGIENIEEDNGENENINFSLPKELQ